MEFEISIYIYHYGCVNLFTNLIIPGFESKSLVFTHSSSSSFMTPNKSRSLDLGKPE